MYLHPGAKSNCNSSPRCARNSASGANLHCAAKVESAVSARWVAAVNADGTRGKWSYRMISEAAEVDRAVDAAVAESC
ncbi:MAG: hypothetical protein OD918_02380 [Gammaproteobacteria bacterium]